MVRSLLLCLACCSLALSSARAATVTTADFLTLTYTDSGGTLPYRMFVPKNYVAATKYPLVLFLHGVGENGTNNTAQLNNRANGAFVFAEQDANPAFMIAPQNWNGAGGWDSDVLRKQILAVIQKAQRDYNIDKDRVYVVGLSNGGAGTWNQISANPWLYAAAVPICGWGSPSDKMKDIPIWCFHAADDGTVGVASSDNAVAAVRNLGGNAIYTRYNTGGHGSWTPAFQTTEMVNWLFAQRRGVRDTTSNPNLKITTPTASKGFSTTATTQTVSGTASDMLPADGASTGITAIAWSNTNGATTTGTGTGDVSWSAANIPLTAGLNRVRITATGTPFKTSYGGNTTFTDVLYVQQGAADTTAPVITITSPATSPFTTTSAIATITGTCTDNTGVVDWLWSSDRGYNGTCQNSFPVLLVSGNNVFTITAKDAAGNTSTRTFTIFLDAPDGNQAPVVNAGRDQTVVSPATTAALDGTVTDDALAPGNPTTTVTWSKVAGGTVTFANANAVDTTATFAGVGVYVLRLTATDGVLSASDDITVVVGDQRLLFDFGAAATTTTGNWNNVSDFSAGQKITGAKDSVGSTTGVNLTLGGTFTGINSNGTTDTTFYPGTAQQDSFYVQATGVGTVQLTGLTAGALYNFTFFASRLGADDRVTEYTIGSTKVSFDPTDNTNNVVQIPFVAGGTVNISIAADGGTGYGYLGVVDVVRLGAAPGGDIANPVVTISTPTVNASYSATTATVNLGGSASDNVGVTQVTWSNNRGGSGTATGTTAWTVNGVALKTGQNILTVTVRDAAGNSATDTLTVTYNLSTPGNNAPTISSGPTANPNPAAAGASVAFTLAASDPDGDALAYFWEFGDGSSDTTAAPAHIFTTAGVYAVLVTVTDGKGGSAEATVSVVVSGTNGGGGGGASVDTDGDGVSDADEIAAGTNPNDPNSGPLRPMTVKSLSGSMKFGIEGKDGSRLIGTITDLPAMFNPNGVAVLLNVGGATAPFTLNERGQARSEQGSFALKLKLTRDKATKTKFFAGGSATFSAKLAKGTWSDDWADEGLNPASDTKNVPTNLNVRITLNGQMYGVTIQALSSTKAGKTGAFKKMK